MTKISSDKIYDVLDWILPGYFIATFFVAYLKIPFVINIFKSTSIILSLILLFNGKLHNANKTYFLFVFILIISILSYFYNGRPLECVNTDLFNLIPATLFFLVGLNDTRNNRYFYEYLMYAGSAVLFVGLVCYITTPAWYTAFILDAKNSSVGTQVEYTESSIYNVLRFYSFFKDSYPVSLFSIYILSISLFSYFRIDRRIKYSNYCCIISFISAIACMHRVSMVYAVIMLMFYVFYEFRKFNIKTFFQLCIVSLLSIFVINLLNLEIIDRFSNLGDMLSDRSSDLSFSSAYNERQGLSKKLMLQWYNPIFGLGLGSGGPTSRFLGFGGVTDAGYTKMLFENGIVGFVLFLGLTISSIIKSLEYYKYYIEEFFVLIFILIAMTGSNTLYMPYEYIIPFWYMMGRVWNKNYFKYAIAHNIKI